MTDWDLAICKVPLSATNDQIIIQYKCVKKIRKTSVN